MALNRLKYSACIFLCLATILLLAHDAVPHHHHGGVACFLGEHCHDHKAGYPDGGTSSNHSDHSSEHNDCLLEELVFTHRLCCGSGATSEPQKHIDGSGAIGFAAESFLLRIHFRSTAILPLADHHLTLTGKPFLSFGLRAPPVY